MDERPDDELGEPAGAEEVGQLLRPLEGVRLPALGELDVSGLVVIVGPNSSGKTQLLRDLHAPLCGQPRDPVVAEAVVIRRPEDFGSYIGAMESAGYLERGRNADGAEELRPLSNYVGSGVPSANVVEATASKWFSRFRAEPDGPFQGQIDFLANLGRLLVAALFLENRLTAVKNVGMIDFDTQPPQNELHA